MKILVLTSEYQKYCSQHNYEYRIMPGAGYINYASILMSLDLTEYDSVFICPTKQTNLLLSRDIEWKNEPGESNEDKYIYNRNNLLFTNDLDWALDTKFYNRTLAQYNLALKTNHWYLLEDVTNSSEIPYIDQAGKLLCKQILDNAGLPAIELEEIK